MFIAYTHRVQEYECVCVWAWVILYTHFRWLVPGYPGRV